MKIEELEVKVSGIFEDCNIVKFSKNDDSYIITIADANEFPSISWFEINDLTELSENVDLDIVAFTHLGCCSETDNGNMFGYDIFIRIDSNEITED